MKGRKRAVYVLVAAGAILCIAAVSASYMIRPSVVDQGGGSECGT